jgi:hypothetical protein
LVTTKHGMRPHPLLRIRSQAAMDVLRLGSSAA